MKKIIVCSLIIFFINCFYTSNATNNMEIIESQKDTLNISSFIKEANDYTKDVFSDMEVGDILNSAITGKVENEKIIRNIWKLFGKEIVNSIASIGSIIVIIIVHSIIKSISDGLENKSISQITYYVQYILIVTLIMTSFSEVLQMVKESIQNLVGFMNILIPLLITLMVTTGSIASASMLQPILLFIITLIGNFIKDVIIPIVLVSTALGIISKISDRLQIDKLSKFFKSSVVWVLGVVLTLFVGIVSLEGTLSSSVDGITAKTTKAAVSSFIPVVGKILGDAVDTVIGCSSILKNALGIVGVVVIIAICVKPIIKLVILMTMYYLGASLCQPIADGKIIKLLDQMGDTFKLLLGILCSVSVMLIIGVTLVVKISNSGLMYR
ncbi:MAG TPA: stage III sporulation protein AE [Clostridiales bacterium]|nr:stage III sporulation protein AE [Clostridiales bacterium]